MDKYKKDSRWMSETMTKLFVPMKKDGRLRRADASIFSCLSCCILPRDDDDDDDDGVISMDDFKDGSTFPATATAATAAALSFVAGSSFGRKLRSRRGLGRRFFNAVGGSK